MTIKTIMKMTAMNDNDSKRQAVQNTVCRLAISTYGLPFCMLAVIDISSIFAMTIPPISTTTFKIVFYIIHQFPSFRKQKSVRQENRQK